MTTMLSYIDIKTDVLIIWKQISQIIHMDDMYYSKITEYIYLSYKGTFHLWSIHIPF